MRSEKRSAFKNELGCVALYNKFKLEKPLRRNNEAFNFHKILRHLRTFSQIFKQIAVVECSTFWTDFRTFAIDFPCKLIHRLCPLFPCESVLDRQQPKPEHLDQSSRCMKRIATIKSSNKEATSTYPRHIPTSVIQFGHSVGKTRCKTIWIDGNEHLTKIRFGSVA